MNSSFGLDSLLEREEKKTKRKEDCGLLCWASPTQHEGVQMGGRQASRQRTERGDQRGSCKGILGAYKSGHGGRPVGTATDGGELDRSAARTAFPQADWPH